MQSAGSSARRILRIFPLYYLVVILVTIHVPTAREDLPWLLSYTLNFRIASLGEYMDHVAHFWSLAVEEQFYVVWPWVVLFAPAAALVPIVLGFIALAPGYRLYGVLTDMNATAMFVSPLSSLDSLGMGALLAVMMSGAFGRARMLAWGWNRLALPAGLVGTVLFYLVSFHTRWWGAGLVAFDAALALLFTWLIGKTATDAFGGLTAAVLEWRPLVYLGSISYGIYVYHVFTPRGVALVAQGLGHDLRPENWVLQGLMAVVATVGVAALSWHLFERPINGLKRRFEPPRGSVDSRFREAA